MAKFKPIKLMPHQKKTLKKRGETSILLDLSEPGTGKSVAHATHFVEHRKAGGGAGLIVAPLSLIDTVWPHEVGLVDPDVDISVAFANNRAKAFQPGHDLYVTNYNGLEYLSENPSLVRKLGIDWFLGDEATAFKNPQAKRTKRCHKLVRNVEFKALLSGSLGAKMITDYFAPTLILDDGKRLGWQFSRFREATCYPVQVGRQAHMIQWEPREGADLAVAQLLQDISIRHLFATTVKQSIRTIEFKLPPKLRKLYEQMAREQAMFLKDKVITAANGGAAAQKLLQIASGSTYDNQKANTLLDMQRYELVADLAEEREKTLIAFQWHHQREALELLLKKRGRTTAYIDGTVPGEKRKAIVEAHKRGEIDDLLLQPQAAAHGLTLVNARTTIWATPTYDYELFDQLNRRTYRTGQSQDCEVIVICAENTLDAKAFEVCTTKGKRMMTMFEYIRDFT
ncbi:hypothetical protein FDH89_gp25 [Pseudomonas phage phiR18]|uniref:Helicase C-terminal domain-containing protein n=1 Tax=Pseudomonas phage phiR18 TaxID=1752027 RepID=A0A0S3UFP7_9CAUD|nr:hypothetical protein FDH89_gp25 [Pseudomonas phage phiR18]BAU16353.1 hypothetical protein [Pseudomonas phage phiR18]